MNKIVILLVVFSTGMSNAQSKKEQIQTLNLRVDSLNKVLTDERNISNQNIINLNSKIYSLENQIKIMNTNIDERIIAEKNLKESNLKKDREIQSKIDEILLLSQTINELKDSIKYTSNIENYYMNEDIFKKDTTYSNVLIDGKLFKVNILSDKLNEHLEKIDFSEYEFVNTTKTIVIYNEANKIVYADKVGAGITLSSLFKPNGNLAKDGKLYFHWVSSAGGSGYSSNTSLVSLVDGKIVITDIFDSDELAFILFNKNDKEIYILRGIIGNGETHFSKHKYKVVQYRYSDVGFEEKILGTTKNKYSSLDEGKSATEILNDIIKGEDFMPRYIVVTEYIIFNNFNGVIVAQ